MGNTYSQIYLHIVFAVQERTSLIQPAWKDNLYKYITGIVQRNKHKILAINGMPDHIHLLITYHPHQSLPELMQAVKGCSSKWINENNFVRGKFNWQEGYGVFSYSQSHLDNVINYINDQEKHHTNRNFRMEYVEMLKKYQVPYNDKYIFHEAL